ncbi:MAG: hypothetical protein JSV22_13000 [Bacteroidales bacterium]|nr:MAG: hypothetical protein JSV22_13000 [Bacteroidales bacterium]
MKLTNKYRTCIYSVFVFILSFHLFTLTQSCKKMDFERIVRIKTGEASEITPNSASVKGVIQDWGKGNITQYGHCWSMNRDPDISLETKTEYDHINIGEYYSDLDSLLPYQTYYVRAYAIYEGNEVYGGLYEFKTSEATLPSVTTASPSNITDSSVTCGGNVTDSGGEPVTARGVCWGTSSYLNLSDSCTIEGSGTGTFTSNLTGLAFNTNYYVRAYATNSVGTGYGDALSFTTEDVIILSWQVSLGGSDYDRAECIRQTTDGGYIVAGYSKSSDGDVSKNQGSNDYWIVKLTSEGDLTWQKSYGGSSQDIAYSIRQTTDGGYIIAGGSSSDDGDVTGNYFNYNYWIVKLNSTGQIIWEKSFGGDSDDIAYSIQQTTDGGYIVAGKSYSNNGDVTGNHGSFDYWIIKLSSTGDLTWQKCLGGSDMELANSIQQTTDGGYVVAGETTSDDGDVTGYHGSFDYWIVKLTSTGEIDWQKALGGSGSEYCNSIRQTTDGGYIIAGGAYSDDGDVSGKHGETDYWIVKLTSTGEIDWQKALGGSSPDYAYSIEQTIDGGYIVAGFARSSDGDMSGGHGSDDYWVVKLSSTGEIEWQRPLGGSSSDMAFYIQQTADGGYIVTGPARSNDGDVSGNHGETDYWIVKFFEK